MMIGSDAIAGFITHLPRDTVVKTVRIPCSIC